MNHPKLHNQNLIRFLSNVSGGDAAAAEVLQSPGRADEPHFIQAAVVHYAGAVPYEVRLEWKWPRHGGCANHHRYRLCRQWYVALVVGQWPFTTSCHTIFKYVHARLGLNLNIHTAQMLDNLNGKYIFIPYLTPW